MLRLPLILIFFLCSLLINAQTLTSGIGLAQNKSGNQLYDGNARMKAKSFRHSLNTLAFEENKGQIVSSEASNEKEILFTMKDKGMTLFFTREGISYQWHYKEEESDSPLQISEATGRTMTEESSRSDKSKKLKSSRVHIYRSDMQWLGTNSNVELVTGNSIPGYSNYYLPHCPEGVHGVKNYAKLTYKNLYPNVDVVYYIKDGHLKYDIVLHPGADLTDVKFSYSGASLSLKEGELQINTPLGLLTEGKPIAFSDNRKIDLGYKYSKNTIAFEMTSSKSMIDKTKPVIIDPSVIWGTYYGATDYDDGADLAIDASGNVYMTGTTENSSGLGSGGFLNTGGGSIDAYLVKFNAAGVRQWATYYGGSNFDEGNSIAIDGSGNIYLAGSTESADVIASGGYQNTYAGGTEGDAYLAKFNSSGVRQWGTYYGGTDTEDGGSISIDAADNVYLGGYTASTSAISSGGHQNIYGGGIYDGFLVKFNSAGALQWGTYYGGVDEDHGSSTAVDLSGNVYLAGDTHSTAGIASGGHQNTYGGSHDAFLVQFNSSGIRQWGTYYGGGGDNEAKAIATDASGNVYLTGDVQSTTGIASGGYQNVIGGSVDAFLVKFNLAGVRQWGTYYGGTAEDYGIALTADGIGNTYLSGTSSSTGGIASVGTFQDTYGGGSYDSFFAKFNSSGVRQWGSYYGGSEEDVSISNGIDGSGNIYLSGYSQSASGIASGGFQNTIAGSAADAFLVKFSDVTSTKTVTTSDSLALVALYNSTNGNGWIDKTNWLTGPVNTWNGVTVTGNRVTGISITGNNLTGSLPAELGNLTALTQINFGQNNLSGPIPTTIGNLTSLQFLRLYQNSLTGSLPSSIGNLSLLKTLTIFENKLSGDLPAGIWDLPSITNIFIRDNQFTGTIPASLGNLTQLFQFIISNNKFTGSIPSEIGNLTALTGVYLNGNQFTGTLPATLNNLTTVSAIDVSNNQFTGAVPVLNNLTIIETLDVSNNQFTDLPDLSGLNTLTSFVATNNFFTFEDIIPNISITGFTYNYQREVPVGNPVSIVLGASTVLSPIIGGTGNVYQWNKNYVAISNATSNSYSITVASPTSAGTYRLQITNPNVPGLTLTTTPFVIDVLSPDAPNDSGYIFWKKIGAESLGITQLQSDGRASIDNLGNYYFTSPTDQSNGTVFQKTDPSGNLLYTIPSGNPDIGGTDIAVDDQNSAYISGPNYNTMRKYNSSGTWVFETQVYSGYRPFQTMSVDVDANSNSTIVVFDQSSTSVKRFDSSTGTLVEQILLTGGPLTFYNSAFDFEVDATGNFYVPDGNRIDKYSPAGVFISSFDVSRASAWGALIFQVASNGHLYVAPWIGGYFPSNGIYHFDDTGVFVNSFDFDFATVSMYSLTISASSEIVVGSGIGIFKFDLNGNFLGFIDSRNANGQFNFATDVATDLKGNRYVADKYNHRIQKFDSKGNFLMKFGIFGTGQGEFNRPSSVTIDNLNNIYVADAGNNRIQKFSSAGNYLLNIGSAGSTDGQFNNPLAVTFSAGFLFVVDAGNYRVQKFTAAGDHVLTFGSQGTKPDQFNSTMSTITVENDGNLLLSDQNMVKRFNSNGTFVNALDLSAYGSGRLSADKSGYFYLTTSSVVRKFDKQGGLVTNVGVSGKADGQFQFANAVMSNLAGDTLWISDLQFNRISIFYAKFKNVSSTDSLALVDLYNSTNGPGWTNKTNWLTGNVDTWYGVSVSGGKVRKVDLHNNLLKGTLPSSLVTLDDLLYLNLSENELSGPLPDWNTPSVLIDLNASDNQLTGAITDLPNQLLKLDLSNNKLSQLPDLKSTHLQLDTVRVEENQLDFGDLEPNVSIKSFSYIPQDSVDVKESVIKQLGENFSFPAIIGGTANAYQWKKNNASIAAATSSTLTFPSISIADDALYNYEATSSIIPGLTLISNKKILRVSSLRRDSLALAALYTSAGGDNWIDHSNWLTTPLGTGNWFGITITNNRVSAVNLSNNNLTGTVPQIVADVLNLTLLDLSHNKIQHLPDLKALAALGTLDVSDNQLDFASLIPNSGITGVNYQSQANIGTASTELVDYGTDYPLKVSTKGEGNHYQWKRNGTDVASAIDSTYIIKAISRSNMGEYVSIITNPAVPDLVLKTAPKKVLATAILSGKFSLADGSGVSKGKIRLLLVKESGGYDTTAVKDFNGDGSFRFEKVVLDNYQLSGFADTLAYAGALPTYYKSTVYWEEGDTLFIDGNREDLNFASVFKPTEVPKGVGIISGYFEEPEVPGGRDEGAKRVSGAGASVRSVATTARPLDEVLTLVAYVFTNDQGEFEMPQLPKGDYRLNIQYPGYPMEPTSFITITIGDGLESQVRVAANVENNKIKVTKLVVTGVWEKTGVNVQVYPNPSADHVMVRFNEASATRSVELVNMLSVKLASHAATQKENSLNVSQYPAGMYFLHIRERGEVVKTVRIAIE